MRRIGVVSDPIFLDHRNPPGHPERVERLTAIRQGLEARGLLGRMTPVAARPATPEELVAVHTPEHVARIASLAGRELDLDPDTYVSPGSATAAHAAAGGSVDLARAVWRGDLDGGFALVRPPGHHAEADRAMGFCLFNNVAVAAAAVREAGAERVAILDWDVHHGNGTQHSFEASPHVLYVSTHQFPYYPGTGDASEAGRGAGRGTTVNIPLPGGCGDAEYLAAFDRIILPVIEQYAPEFILVSAGFDAHAADPLASMQVTGAGFGAMAARVRDLADRACGGKIVYLLEGGYDLTGLQEGVGACVADLLDPQPAVEAAEPNARAAAALDAVIRIQSAWWKLA